MKTEAAYLVTIHHMMFRPGMPARILGVMNVAPGYPALGDRLCYHVLFADGREDYVPLMDSAKFEIISRSQFDRGEIPKVIS